MDLDGWKVFLLLALWCEDHEQPDSEQFFVRAQHAAETDHGKSSLAVGEVLMEFAEFLEKLYVSIVLPDHDARWSCCPPDRLVHAEHHMSTTGTGLSGVKHQFRKKVAAWSRNRVLIRVPDGL